MADFYIPNYNKYRYKKDDEDEETTTSSSSKKTSKSNFYIPSYDNYAANLEKMAQAKAEAEQAASLATPAADPQKGGNFLADIGGELWKAATDSYKRVGEGAANVIGEVTGENQRIRDNLAKQSDDIHKAQLAAIQKSKDTSLSEDERKKWRTLVDQYTKEQNEATAAKTAYDDEIREENDPIKGVGALASVGLDVATAGIGGKVAKGAVQIGKTGLNMGVKEATKRVAKEVGKGAGLGAAYGVTGTAMDQGAEAGADDYALNAAFGAGIGGALGGLTYGISKGAGKFIEGRKTAKENSAKNIISKNQADKDDLNAVLNQAIEEQSDKYGKSKLKTVTDAIGDQFNPYRSLAKIDDEFAKTNKIKRTDLLADESLEDLARRSAASEREAAGLFEKKLVAKAADGSDVEMSASDLVKKYDADSPEGQEFNNYTNAKFFQEIRKKKGKSYQLPDGVTDENLAKFVDDYELKNPDALKDIAIKKAVNDEAVDYLVRSKAMSKEEGDQIKNAYKFAVPLDKIFPDDLARPQVSGNNIGSITKQTAIQKLETGSVLPPSNSFDSMLNRVYKAVAQGNRAKLAQKLLERQEQGLVKGGKLLVTAGNKEARKEIRENIALVNKGVRVLESKVKVSSRQMRRIESELNKLNKEGLDVSLSQGGKTPISGVAAGELDRLSKTKGKTNTSRQFFKSLVESDPAQLQSIRNKIATREPKLAKKLDEIMNMQSQIEANKAAKTNMRNVIADFGDDPTTGKQVVSGVIDGQSFKMEVPPDLAKTLQGLDQQKLVPVMKALAIAKKPFEVAWTGVLNPVFSGISFAFYDTPMSIINSPQGFKTLAPKAIAESFKSINASSEFQQKLAQYGARPYGGSGASTFIKPDAKSIAAQRGILSNIKYTSTHPERALSKLDVWGGKLANMTRTRVARSAYDDAIKKGATEAQAMANATLAYRTIMPDFDTMSNLTRNINAVVPFYAASLAGTRSLGQALKRNPVNTSAKILGLGVAPITGVTAFSLMQPAGQEFYADMEKNSPQTLDNNMVVVLPGASKNKETGEWEGVIKVPLAPEFRAMNQSIWRGVRGAMGKGDGPEASHIALSILDTITGGVRTSQNPLIDTVRILSGEDPRTGERIVKGSMADRPKSEQAYDSTSGAANFAADTVNNIDKFFGGEGNKVSPIQADKFIGQFGLAGQTVKNGGNPVEAVTENVSNRFSGAYGERAADSFFKTYTPIKSQRDKASKEVTELVKAGKIGEAKRKAEEFNKSLQGKFSDYYSKYEPNEDWDDMAQGLFIKTSDSAFSAREKQ